MASFRVYLVRHAEAEQHASGGDDARRLTASGRRSFAALLARLGPRLALARVVTSPSARARETGELLAAAAGAPLDEDPALASGRSSGRELLELARAAGPGAALVGHNPEIAEAIALAALGPTAAVRPGTVAALLFEGGLARLEWILAPGDGPG